MVRPEAAIRAAGRLFPWQPVQLCRIIMLIRLAGLKGTNGKRKRDRCELVPVVAAGGRDWGGAGARRGGGK